MSESPPPHEYAPEEQPDPPAADEDLDMPAPTGDAQQHIPVDDEEGDDEEKPLDQRLADEAAERRVREASLGTSVHGSAHRISHSALFETHNGDINLGFGQQTRVRAYLLKAEDIRRINDNHVEVPSCQDLVKRLSLDRVAVLKGHPKSGRHWAALAALGQWANQGASEGLVRRHGTLTISGDPEQVDANRLPRHTAYVLDATGAPWTRQGGHTVLRHLEYLADELHARFVVLTDPDGLPGHASITHVQPDPREVFDNWFAWYLDQLGGSSFSALPEALRKVADENRTPGEGADLAREAAMFVADGGEPEEFLTCLPNALREEAEGLLRDPKATLHQRCFLISVAVLNELPLVTVSRAAADLAELVPPLPPQPVIGDNPPAWEWLSDSLQFAQAKSTVGESMTEVGLKRPRLAHAILETVWQEGQSIREPILEWLGRLSKHQEKNVRIRAAHALGRIATHDFKLIEADFLRPWSRSRRQNDSWLAAWALEAAYVEHASPRLLDCLNGWVRTMTTRRTAARAYGSRIGAERINDALADFRYMVTKSSPRQRALHDAIARALMDVYGPVTAPAIIEELAAWSKDEHAGLRRIAALSLTRLAIRDADGNDRLRLHKLDEESWPETESLLAAAWRNALTCGLRARGDRRAAGPPVHEAWTAFGSWVTGWNDISHRHQAVIRRVFAKHGGDLYEPLLLHLCHWYRLGATDAELSKQLHNLMKGRP